MSASALWGLKATEDDLNLSVDRHVEAMILSQHVLSRSDEVAIAIRDAALANDDAQVRSALARVGPAQAQISKDFELLRALPLAERGRNLVEAAYAGLGRNATLQDRFLQLVDQQQTEQAVNLLKGEIAQQHAEYRGHLTALVDYEENALESSILGVEQRIDRLNLFIGMLAALALVVAAVVTTLITRWLSRMLGGEPATAQTVAIRVAECDLRHDVALRANDDSSVIAAIAEMQRRLRHVVAEVRAQSEEVATTSAQIAQATLDLSNRTETQASNLEETAASMEELTATVRQNAEYADQAAISMEEARKAAEQGGVVMNDVVTRMEAINQSARRIEEIIDESGPG